MMIKRLENIGFYTLSDDRARNAGRHSPMWRCEMILTSRCNFSCAYCRKLQPPLDGDISLSYGLRTLALWVIDGLRNIRFSGGEPTLHPYLKRFVSVAAGQSSVANVAVSTNGSASLDLYKELVDLGVNDFSVSLDGCCASDVKQMSGGAGDWRNIQRNIAWMAEAGVYITAGVVVTEDNMDKLVNIVQAAHNMGFNDVRVISAAQWNEEISTVMFNVATALPDVVAQMPILAYRIGRAVAKHNVRGIANKDTNRCYLVMDDSCVVQNYHFPCVIYMREGGDPIGEVGPDMREHRLIWALNHNTHEDPICRTNCLDVCVEYNNKIALTNRHLRKLQREAKTDGKREVIETGS